MDAHSGNVMPDTAGREFAYEDEVVSRPMAVITAYHNSRRGRKDLNGKEREEQERYSEYEFSIRQHTGNYLEITLRKQRRDIVEQRRTGGKVVTHDVYTRGISFAELVNLLFAECQHFEDTEAYPDSIHEAMKTAYT